MSKNGKWLAWKRRNSVSIPKPSRIHMRALEPRILLDAASAETALDAVHNAVHESFADTYLAENFSADSTTVEGSGPSSNALEALPAYVADDLGTTGNQRVELAFIAADVPNLEQLLAELPSGTELIVLNGDGDGVAQIAEALSLRSNIDAIHIISHGEQGSLSLGSSELTSETMANEYRAQMAMIGDALTEGGDILVYGCEFAEGEIGRQAVELLSDLTKADIAASTDITGAASLGGDWRLELATGVIETSGLNFGNEWSGSLGALELYAPPVSNINFDARIGLNRFAGEIYDHVTAGGGTYEIGSVDLAFKQDAAAPAQTVIVDFYRQSDDVILTTGTLSTAAFTTSYAWYNIQFNSIETLNSGEDYYFLVNTDSPSETVYVGAVNANVYANGEFVRPNYSTHNNRDLVFSLNTPFSASAPSITSLGGGANGEIDVMEGQTDVMTVIATDPDIGDTLVYSKTNESDGGFFNIDSATGVLSFATAPDFENPQDFGGGNTYRVNVTVTDSQGGFDVQSIEVTVTNNEPSVAMGKTIITPEDTAYVFIASDFEFTDTENDPLISVTITNLSLAGGALSYASGTIPVTNGMTISLSGLADLTYMPDIGNTAPATFDYVVNGLESGTVTAAMIMNISNNSAPVIAGGASEFPTMAENQTLAYTVIATDSDLPAETLTYSIIGGADESFFNIDSSSGVLSFITAPDFETPLDLDTGTTNTNNIYTVEVQVSDGNGGIDTQIVHVFVTDVNLPVATGNTVTTVEDTDHIFTASEFEFLDDEGDALQSITITSLGLAGGTLTHTAGTVTVTNGMTVTLAEIADLTFSPATSSNANASFDYAVNDADFGVVSATMSITVNAVNDVPVITSGGGVFETDVTISENQTYANTFIAADVDLPADTLTFSIIGGSDQALFALDSATGVLSFINAPDFETILDSNSNNIYNVIVEVSDGNGGTDSQLLHVYIADVDEAPSSIASSVTINEDTPYIFDLTDFGYSDPENDAIQSVTFTGLSLVGGTLVHTGGTVAVTNGMTVTVVELADLTFSPALNSTSDASFDFTVNDANTGASSASFDIYITAINDAPIMTTGGGLAEVDVIVTENQTSVITVSATDPDPGDNVTYSIIASVDNAHFSVDSVTGVLTFLVAPDFENPTDSNTNNKYNVRVRADDGNGGTSVQKFAVHVTNANEVPVATGGAVTTNEDTVYDFFASDFGFTDIENNALQSVTISNLSLGAGALTIFTGFVTDGMTLTAADIATLKFIPTSNSSAPASFDYTVNDDDNGVVSATMAITVTPVNDAPVITSLGGVATFTGTSSENDTDLLTYTATDVDLPGDTLSYSIIGGEDAALFQIGEFTGELSFINNPDYENPLDVNNNNRYWVEIEVSDGNGGTDIQELEIFIANENEAPVAEASNITMNEDTTHTFAYSDFAFSDPEDHSLTTITITNLNLAGGTLTTDSGTTITVGMTVASVNYTPAANSSLNASFDFTANDTFDTGTVSATMTIVVNEVNDNPIISNFSSDHIAYHSVDEGTTFVVDYNATDVDLASGTLTYSIVGGSDAADFSIDAASGIISFISAPDFENPVDNNFSNVYHVHVQVDDGIGGTDVQHLRLTVDDVDELPVAAASGITTDEDVAHTFTGADFNFADPENDALQSVTITNIALAGGALIHSGGTPVTNGMLVTAAELASMSFTPAANSSTNGSFDFSVNDANFGATTATMMLVVNAVNDLPVATGGAVSTNEDVARTFVATDFNFTDVENDALQSVTILNLSLAGGTLVHSGGTAVTNGTVITVAELASLTFTPAPSSSTNASFDYTANDADAGTVAASMAITVNAINDLPEAIASAVNTLENTARTFEVADFNFTDVENDALQSVTITNISLAGGTLAHSGGTAVTNGMVITAAEIASLIFTPALNSNATASFDYSVNDADAGTAVASMTITVDPFNDLPVATGGAVSTDEDVALTFTVADFSYTDIETDALQSISISTLNLAGGTLVHSSGIPVTVGMTITAAEIASLTFTPALNSSTNASFDYTVNDADAGIVAASMAITVNAINDLPEAIASVVTTNEDTAHTFAISDFNFTDVENNALQSITISNLSLAGGTLVHSGGTVVINGMTVTSAELASLVFMPALNSNVGASFDYTVSDADTGIVSATMEISIIPVNNIPTATGGTVTTTEDTPFIFDVTDFAFNDIENDPLQSITISNLSLAGGSLTHSNGTIVADGMTVNLSELASLIFSPALNSSTNASFDYTVNDDDAGATAAAMTINVTPANDAPDATGGAIITNEDSFHIFAASDFNFTDVEGDQLQSVTVTDLNLAGGTLTHSGGAIIVTNGMSVSLAELADLTYTPAPNITLGANFNYSVNDANSGGSTAPMQISVTPINDAPVSSGASITTLQNSPHIFSVSDFHYVDVENDILQSVTITNLSLGGGVMTHSAGTIIVTNGMVITAAELADLTFTPASGQSTSGTFDYSVNDTDVSAVVGMMTINISDPVNPIITTPEPSTPVDPVTIDPIDPEVEETPEETEEVVISPETTTSTPVTATPPTITPAPAPAVLVAAAPPVAAPEPEPELDLLLEEPELVLPQESTQSPDKSEGIIPNYTFQPVDRVRLKQNIDLAGKDVRRYEDFLGTTAAKVSFTFGSLLSVGGVSFVLRGGALAAALMSALPAWNRFDPISVVAKKRDEDEEEDEDVSDAQMMKKFVEDARSRVNKGSIL
ncbi:MAG: Ig-like domain-containing protein [Rhizobiaceae bacterium]